MRRRIIVLYIVLALLVSTVVAFVTYRYSADLYVSQTQSSLRHQVLLIRQILQQTDSLKITDAHLRELTELIHSLDQENSFSGSDRRITLIDVTGKVLADSSGLSSAMENHRERTEFKEALSSGLGYEIRKSETTNLMSLYLACFSQELNAVVRISASVDYINHIRDTIIIYTVLAVVVALILSSPFIFKISDYVIRPLARLVREYSQGGEARNTKGRKDEIGQLSFTLSSMTRYLEDVLKELQDRNARVDAIINSMDSGLIAVDQSMHILMLNPVAHQIFGVAQKPVEVGVPLVQVIRHRQINELLNKAIAKNMAINDEIQLFQGGKRVLWIHVTPIRPMDNENMNSGALAFINDITQVRKLEEMRSEFVANVTHELKTPLTSIQGFVETLKAGAIKDPLVAEKFLDIIDIEADRLRTLINDILELSEIENMKQDRERETIRLKPLVDEVISMLKNAAEEQSITIYNELPENLTMYADGHRMKQLFINLMDNALKYNRKGGSVWVFSRLNKDVLELHVKDTGIGIQKEHTARIFERFYRVDKGRSRAMGGTGLGLSIVKHIAQLYGGSVHVESMVGEGSDFVVSLPYAGKESSAV
jgi:two-component system phosphate regulon sensor histidine kinase PhoR